MRFLLGMLFILVVGSTASFAQVKRDDRTNKSDPKRETEQEKAQKEYDKLPEDQKKVLLEVGKDIKKEQDEKSKKDSSKKSTTTSTDKSQDKPKTNSAVPPVPAPKTAEEKPAETKTEPAATTTAATPKKPAPKKAVADKTADKKGGKKEEEEKKDVPKPKEQKKPKSKVKFSEEQLKEFSLYTERVTSDPDEADVAVMLPKTGQPITNEVRLKKGAELVEKHFPDKALSLLQELVKKDPKNSNYNYWLGRAYLEGYNAQVRAIPYLIKASEHTDYAYQTKYPEKNILAPIDALYYLGLAYQHDGNLEKADRQLRLYVSVAKPDDPMKKQAELRIQQIAVAEKMVKTPKKNVSVTNAGAINTPYADYSPFVTVDGTELFFTTARPMTDVDPATTLALDAENGKYFDDVYVANLNPEGKWMDAKPINIDSAGNDVVRGISTTSKVMWLYQDNATTADLYESSFAFDAWQVPTIIVNNQNTLKWGKNFSIDIDRTIVYFASKDLGGFGGSDIFFSYKNEDGTWTEPTNVGANVNTIYDEDMPYLHPNKRVLYYSSNSTRSMGGYDIFRSLLVGEWQTGENMGYPINTLEDDLYFSLAPDGKSAYYSRKGRDSKGDLDIYQVNFFSNTASLPPRLQASFKIDLKKAPVVKKGKKPKVEAEPEPEETNEIVLTNVLTKEQFIYIPNIRTGNFSVFLDPCTKYNIEYRKNGAAVRTEDFVAPCDMQANNSTLLFDPLGNNTPTSPRPSNMPLVDKTEANLQGYAWQLQRFGNAETTMSYQDINYLDAKGNILKSVKLDSEGIFQFEDIPGDQDYIFEINVPEKDCSTYRVVLMKDRKKVADSPIYQVICFQ